MSTPWVGRLELGFERRGEATVLVRAYQQAPFKVQRPFYPEGPGVCHVLTLHNAGGVVGGDRLELAIALEAGAHAVLAGASASKLYRSTGALASQVARVQVGEGACLEWPAREAIAFDGARWAQSTHVALAAEATYLGWDIARFGRTARGERFLAGTWRTATEVWQHGRPLWIERAHLPPGAAAREGALGLAGRSVVATMLWVGRPAPDALMTALRAVPAPAGPGVAAGVSRLAAGVVARYRGDSTADARGWFAAMWPLLRAASGLSPTPALVASDLPAAIAAPLVPC